MPISAVYAWAVACCVSLEPQAPPLSLQQPYAVVADTVIEQTRKDPLTDSSYVVEMARIDLTFPYRGYDGTLAVGNGRLFLPNVDMPPDSGLPLAISIHYGAGAGAAARFVDEGWAMLTPVKFPGDHGGNLVGDGLSHTLSMVELGRRLPWVDTRRIAHFGGSAGGYQCLMASAMRFGAACAWAAVPPSDLQYNIRYLVENDRFNEDIENSDEWPVPVIHVVRSLGDQTTAALDSTAESWWRYSVPPLAPLIRNPQAMTWSTADILVPVNQAGRQWVQRPDADAFPEGYTFDYAAFANPLARGRRLVEMLPREETAVFVVPTPDDAARMQRLPKLSSDTLDVERPPAPFVETPWSGEMRFSVVIFDEGAPDSACNHRKYNVRQDNTSFFRHYMGAGGPPADAMTPDVMRYLVARWNGVEEFVGPGSAAWVTRTDFQPLERWDVLLAQDAYLRGGDGAVRRWADSYRSLPGEGRVWDVARPARDDVIRADDDPVAAMLYHMRELAIRDRWEERAEVLTDRLLTDHARSGLAELVRTPRE